MTTTIKFFVAFTLASVLAGSRWDPARFDSGELPLQPPMTGGGGEVLLEVGIDDSGKVTDVTVLRSTPPFADLLQKAASQWQFAPAREILEESLGPVAVESKVLVAGLFRPPTLYDAPARGGVPQDIAPASKEIPFPTTISAPLYSPTAYAYLGRTVLVEADVGEDGDVTTARVIGSAAGLDAASTDAARRWKFRPARRNGRSVPAVVYIVFGFREPVIS